LSGFSQEFSKELEGSMKKIILILVVCLAVSGCKLLPLSLRAQLHEEEAVKQQAFNWGYAYAKAELASDGSGVVLNAEFYRIMKTLGSEAYQKIRDAFIKRVECE
jgi:hypothetical protein